MIQLYSHESETWHDTKNTTQTKYTHAEMIKQCTFTVYINHNNCRVLIYVVTWYDINTFCEFTQLLSVWLVSFS